MRRRTRSTKPAHGKPKLTRRQFIRFGVAAAASVPALSMLERYGLAQGSPTEMGDLCESTHGDIEGPYYRPGAPYTSMLAEPTEPGHRLVIRGIVYGPDCVTPLENAIVDIWQANDGGRYDVQDGPTTPMRLRGQILTGADGSYQYETILPGQYPLGNSQYRPSHIHYKVRADGHYELTTQLYFDGDPYIPDDPWASEAEPTRIIDLADTDAVPLGQFDVVLASSL